MVTKIHDGSNWKNINGLKLHNGTSWRNATKGWIWNGSLWKQWYPEYPINTSSPTVSGSTTQGQTLSVALGSWNSNLAYTPTSYTYQWLRSGSSISGATSSTYTTVLADVGNAISCIVTAVNNRGSTPATSSNSINIISATYTISYAGNGNTGGTAPSSPTTVTNGSTFTIPSNTYTRTGYTFSSWYSSQTAATYTAGQTHPAVTGNLTLTALWTINTYSISYSGNSNTGGSAPASPTTATYNSTFTIPSNSYSRTGYTFSSWLSSQTGSTYTAGQTHPAVTGNLTLTAQWTVNTYSISYSGNSNTGGSAPTSPTTVNYGSTFATPTNTYSRTGYTFSGWLSSQNSITYSAGATHPAATGNITLTAQWTANTLTVTWDSQGGSAITSTTTTTGGTVSNPGSPTRSGYTFNGWFTSTSGGTAISFPYTHGQTSNFTLYAQWTANNLTAPTITSATYSGGVLSVSFSGGSGPWYQIWYQAGSDFSSVQAYDAQGTSSPVTLSNSSLSGTYNVAVRSVASSGLTGSGPSSTISSWSSPVQFTASSGGGSVGSTSFVSVTSDICPGTAFVFTPATNATCYDFYWNTTTSGPSAGTTPDYSCQSSTPSGSNRYVYINGVNGAKYWWVRGKDGSGNTGPWSSYMIATIFGGC